MFGHGLLSMTCESGFVGPQQDAGASWTGEGQQTRLYPPPCIPLRGGGNFTNTPDGRGHVSTQVQLELRSMLKALYQYPEGSSARFYKQRMFSRR